MNDFEQAPMPLRERIISTGGLEATISLNGAYLESLRTLDGDELLFPKQVIKGKDRGGIPICAPVFGPAAQLGLNQHGFARDLPWVIDQDVNGDSSKLFLKLDRHSQDDADHVPSQYSGLVMGASFEVLENDGINILNMGLDLTNKGTQPLVVTPGFHPYFPAKLADDEALEVASSNSTNSFLGNELNAAKEIPETEGGIVRFLSGRHQVRIASTGLNVPVVWSSSPDRFVCVEPTAAGALRLNQDGSIDQEQLDQNSLNPGQTRSYSMTINWSPLAQLDQEK